MSISVILTEDEALLLDGKCGEYLQKEIDKIKSCREKAKTMPDYLARLLSVAESEGVLEEQVAHGYPCSRCKAPGKHQPLYVRGPKKGQPNPHKKVSYLWAVRIGGETFCVNCHKAVLEEIKKHADLMMFESKISGIPTKVLKNQERHCRECKGLFFDLGEQSTTCPLCKKRVWSYGRTGKWNLITPEEIVVARRML